MEGTEKADGRVIPEEVMKWHKRLGMIAALIAVGFLWAVVYSLNLPLLAAPLLGRIQ